MQAVAVVMFNMAQIMEALAASAGVEMDLLEKVFHRVTELTDRQIPVAAAAEHIITLQLQQHSQRDEKVEAAAE
jgi:hypothetical protein